MKNYELIDYCRSRDSGVCSFCPYVNAECKAFVDKYKYVPNIAPRKFYTDEEIEVLNGKQTERNC